MTGEQGRPCLIGPRAALLVLGPLSGATRRGVDRGAATFDSPTMEMRG